MIDFHMNRAILSSEKANAISVSIGSLRGEKSYLTIARNIQAESQ